MQVQRKFNYMNLLLILVFVLGLGILLYPNISNYFNERNSSKAMSDYDETVSIMNEEERRAMMETANSYNKKLISDPIGRFAAFTAEQLAEYMATLNVDGGGMMCYLKIEKLGVSLPVYHGTTEEVLQKYVGHVEGTSLPTGGLGTHCALSGHRGLPTAVLFTNLDRMEIGDIFTIAVLGQEHTYVVDQIETVLPDDMSLLAIDPEKDYVTLITCTPYGVNTHRLMVRGVRVPDEEVEEVIEAAEEHDRKPFDFTREQIVNFIAIGLSGLFVLVVLPLLLFVPVPKRIIVLRPWDDNIDKVFESAIKASEWATRANWEMDELMKPADFMAAMRRWDNTVSNKEPISEMDENRKWHEYMYEDEEDELSEEEKKNYREWDDDILEKVDQDWKPLDRPAWKQMVKFTDIIRIFETGKLEEDVDHAEHFEKENRWGNELINRSKKNKDDY